MGRDVPGRKNRHNQRVNQGQYSVNQKSEISRGEGNIAMIDALIQGLLFMAMGVIVILIVVMAVYLMEKFQR